MPETQSEEMWSCNPVSFPCLIAWNSQRLRTMARNSNHILLRVLSTNEKIALLASVHQLLVQFLRTKLSSRLVVHSDNEFLREWILIISYFQGPKSSAVRRSTGDLSEFLVIFLESWAFLFFEVWWRKVCSFGFSDFDACSSCVCRSWSRCKSWSNAQIHADLELWRCANKEFESSPNFALICCSKFSHFSFLAKKVLFFCLVSSVLQLVFVKFVWICHSLANAQEMLYNSWKWMVRFSCREGQRLREAVVNQRKKDTWKIQ